MLDVVFNNLLVANVSGGGHIVHYFVPCSPLQVVIQVVYNSTSALHPLDHAMSPRCVTQCSGGPRPLHSNLPSPCVSWWWFYLLCCSSFFAKSVWLFIHYILTYVYIMLNTYQLDAPNTLCHRKGYKRSTIF